MFRKRGLNPKENRLLSSSSGEDFLETRIIGLRSMMLLMVAIGLVVGGYLLVSAFRDGFKFLELLPVLAGAVFFTVSVIAYRLGKMGITSWFVVLTIISAFTLELIFTGGISQFSFYGFFVLAFLGGMVLRQPQAVALAITIIALAFFQYIRAQFDIFFYGVMSPQESTDFLLHSLLLCVSVAIGSVLGQELDRVFERSQRFSQQFRAIFNQSADAIFITDLNFRIQELNQQAVELLDQSAENVVGKRIQDFAPKEIEMQVNELANDVLVKGKLSNIKMPIVDDEGTQQFLQISANLIFLEGGAPDHIQIILRDITERMVVEDRIQRLALKDHLTKVDNRLSLNYRLNSMITKMNRDGGNFALVYFDLNNFKAVNDRYGHLIGDRLLVAFTKRLQGAIRTSDFLARIGGDEFVLLIEHVGSERPLDDAVARITNTLQNPFKIGEHLIRLEASFGISRYPEDSSNAGELLNLADSAMYTSKRT